MRGRMMRAAAFSELHQRALMAGCQWPAGLDEVTKIARCRNHPEITGRWGLVDSSEAAQPPKGQSDWQSA